MSDKVKPTKAQVNEFINTLNMLNKNTYMNVTDRGLAVIEVVMRDGISDTIPFKDMAVETMIYELTKRLEDLKHMKFIQDHVNPITEEVTRPYGR